MRNVSVHAISKMTTFVILAAAAAIWIFPSPQALEPIETERTLVPDGSESGGNHRAAPGSCTIFTISKGETTFFGNNEDWVNPNTYIWSKQPRTGGYDGLFFGFDDLFPQGGVNEKGLAFDWNATPEMALNSHFGLKPAPGKFGEYLLAKAANVEEAIALIRSLDWGPSLKGQIHLADAQGNAAVMGAGKDGEWAVTRKGDGDAFLVSTNFNLPAPEVGGHPCMRYERATTMLEELMEGDGLEVAKMAEILDAVHQEGSGVNTVYANTIDLSRGLLTLYHWYQFDEAVTLEVSKAIDRFSEPTPMRELFSPVTVEQAEEEYQRHLNSEKLAVNSAKVWLLLLAVSLPLQILLPSRKQGESSNERWSWITSTVVLGPLAVALRLIHRRKGSNGDQSRHMNWSAIVSASAVRSAGYAVALLLTVPYFIFVEPNPRPLSILLATYLFPLLFGWILFRGLSYASQSELGLWTGLRQLAVSELTGHNFVFGATFAAFFQLSERWFSSGITGDDPLVYVALTLSVLTSVAAVLPFTVWMANRGIAIWPWKDMPELMAQRTSLDLRTGWAGLAISLVFAGLCLGLTVSGFF